MFQIIKPDSNFNFLGLRQKAFMVSGALILISFALLFIKGFNFGIDFKGGSSAIVAFKQGSVTDRTAIEKSVGDMLTSMDISNSQVSVQGFGAGTGDTLDGQAVDRFLIYTEITSLVGEQKRVTIDKLFKDKFGESVRIASSADAGDRFYVTFDADVDIITRAAEIKEILAGPGVGFKNVEVTSDLERQVEVEFLREVDLQRADEAKAEASSDAGVVEVAALSVEDLKRRRQEAIVGKLDKRFMVEVSALKTALEEKLRGTPGLSDGFLEVESSATVSPSVGADLFNDGMLAILYSLIGILVYVTLRFDFRFAPGGVVALAHDAIITMGIVSAFDLKFSLPIVAALLTVVGYSINDTIIVYDRIRENMLSYKGKGLLELLNRSVNETMSRTVLTSGTTLIAIIAILVFGGGTIADFAITLFFGIAIGTYSSIFIAAPFVHYLDHFFRAREAEKKEEEAQSKKRGGNTPAPAKDKKKASSAA